MREETTICEICEVRLPEDQMEYTRDGYICPECIRKAREHFFKHWRLLKAGELIQEGDEWSDEGDWGAASRAGTVVTETEEGNYRRRISNT